MKTTWLHSMVQGDATQYYRKRNGIMVEHMVRPANFVICGTTTSIRSTKFISCSVGGGRCSLRTAPMKHRPGT